MQRERKVYHDNICYSARQFLVERLDGTDKNHHLQVDYSARPQFACTLGPNSEDKPSETTESGTQGDSGVPEAEQTTGYFVNVVLPKSPGTASRTEAIRNHIASDRVSDLSNEPQTSTHDEPAVDSPSQGGDLAAGAEQNEASAEYHWDLVQNHSGEPEFTS